MTETCYACGQSVELVGTTEGAKIAKHAHLGDPTRICKASGRRPNRRVILTTAGWTVLVSYQDLVAARDPSGRFYAIINPPSLTSCDHVLSFVKDEPYTRVNREFLEALVAPTEHP